MQAYFMSCLHCMANSNCLLVVESLKFSLIAKILPISLTK